MSLRPLLGAIVIAFSAIQARAQAPIITPAGDPSVNADTIYKLAVNPADVPEQTTALLLDDGVIRLDADGRGTRTYRQIVQILRPEAVDNWNEQRFSYAPRHQKFTINWIRVVKPDGTVISAAPTQVQESDVPAQLGDPTYSDRKVVRVSLTGVAPGTLIDYSTTIEELKPFLPGDFFESWSISTGTSVQRSRYIVDVPAGYKPRIVEENLNFKRTEHTAKGRHSFMWAAANLPRIKPEPFQADSNGVYMSVYVSSPTTWAAIGKWYADSARSRYVTTPAVDSAIHAAVNGARTLEDSIKGVHRWVAQDIRYVSIDLGLGGYQPRTPDEVVRTGYGDCKDKATLFVTAMGKMGITAFPVILNASGVQKPTMPSIEQLDHAIAAFKRPGDQHYEYTDLTARFTPLGEIPYSYQGKFGLVVHPDGGVEQITFPKAPLTDNTILRRVVGTLSPDGLFNGSYEETTTGAQQYDLRGAFENPLDSTQRAKAANALAADVFEGAQGDSIVGTPGKDLGITPSMRVLIRNGKAASMAGNNAILTNPFGSSVGLLQIVHELKAGEPRKFPIAAQSIYGYAVTKIELRVTLPEGWKAQLPANVVAKSQFGSYESLYSQEGRDFVMRRTLTGDGGHYPPDQVSALITWMQAVAKDDSKLIVISRDVP
jgi:transglutaminase-like putative cysteine protease